MLGRLLGVVLAASLAMQAGKATADAALPLRQFDHTAWTLRGGAPADIVAIAQTTDGFLWLGTANGLFRFDGVHFQLYQPPSGQKLMGVSVSSLLAMPDGGLWIGYTIRGASFLKDGRLQNFEIKRQDMHGTSYGLALDPDGSVWSAFIYGPAHFVDGKWQVLGKEVGFDAATATQVFVDHRGTVWVGTDVYVYYRKKGAARFQKTGFKGGFNAYFEEAPDGTVWMVDDDGVGPLREDQLDAPTTTHFLKMRDIGGTWFDRGGALWLFSIETGVNRIADPAGAAQLPMAARVARLEHFSAQQGLTSNRIMLNFSDREGSIWIATPNGLDRFRPTVLQPAPFPTTFGTYSLVAGPEGSVFVGTDRDSLYQFKGETLSKVKAAGDATRVDSTYQTADGRLWLGGSATMGFLDKAGYKAIPVPPEIAPPPWDVQAVTVGPDGDLWMSVTGSAGLLRLHGKQWQPAAGTPKFAGPAVTLLTDHSGKVWAGYMDGLVIARDGEKATVLDATKGITVGNVTALYDSGQQIWIGGSTGLDLISNGLPVAATFSGDEVIAGISGIIQLKDGSLWLNALPGIVRVPPQEVASFLKDPAHAMRYRLFNYLDGLPGAAPQLRPLPSVALGTDGRLWFTTTSGAVSLDPEHIPTNPIVPPVAVVGLSADHQPYNTASSVVLPSGAQNLQIDYTALSLSVPERVRFRYQLEGFDRDWQDVGTRRQAFYSRLPPGNYRFHVIACNNDGLWNETGATLEIKLLPAFYQTRWFHLVCALLIAGIIVLAYRQRVNALTAAAHARMEIQLLERERIARELHDTLLQSVQGLMLRFQAWTSRIAEPDPLRHELQDVLHGAAAVMREGRERVRNLREDLVAAPALSQSLIEAAAKLRHGNLPNFNLALTGEPRSLTPSAQLEINGIAVEALTNAFQHANANNIEAELIYTERELMLRVTDDGCGIAEALLLGGVKPDHWGITGMRERAIRLRARLEVRRRAEGGTEIELKVPAVVAYERRRLTALSLLLRSSKP